MNSRKQENTQGCLESLQCFALGSVADSKEWAAAVEKFPADFDLCFFSRHKKCVCTIPYIE